MLQNTNQLKLTMEQDYNGDEFTRSYDCLNASGNYIAGNADSLAAKNLGLSIVELSENTIVDVSVTNGKRSVWGEE